MLNFEGPSESSNIPTLTIEKIAKALNCPVAAFSEPASCDPEQTVALLQLWDTIRNEQDRRKVLAFVRRMANLFA